jgi:hypothetical protein
MGISYVIGKSVGIGTTDTKPQSLSIDITYTLDEMHTNANLLLIRKNISSTVLVTIGVKVSFDITVFGPNCCKKVITAKGSISALFGINPTIGRFAPNVRNR